jgi:hypothetical protein
MMPKIQFATSFYTARVCCFAETLLTVSANQLSAADIRPAFSGTNFHLSWTQDATSVQERSH